MVTANNYMFRPLTSHQKVVHTMKRVVLYSPQPFPLDIQPDDGLLESETCSCYIACYIYISIYICVCVCVCVCRGCPRRKGQKFGRVFLMLKYTDTTQNTYIQS
jgi:hypothetical protein